MARTAAPDSISTLPRRRSLSTSSRHNNPHQPRPLLPPYIQPRAATMSARAALLLLLAGLAALQAAAQAQTSQAQPSPVNRIRYVTATAGRFADCQAACRAVGSNWNAVNGGRAADQNACAWYGTFGYRPVRSRNPNQCFLRGWQDQDFAVNLQYGYSCICLTDNRGASNTRWASGGCPSGFSTTNLCRGSAGGNTNVLGSVRQVANRARACHIGQGPLASTGTTLTTGFEELCLLNPWYTSGP